MLKRLWFGQRGVLLAWVLMLLAILSVLTVAALTLASNQFVMGSHYSSSVKSLHYAEGGIYHYLAYLNSASATPESAPPLNQEIPYEGGCYILDRVEDDQSGGTILRSTGWTKTGGQKSDPRTVEVLLKKRTFAEYGYFSQEEGDNIWWLSKEKSYGPLHTNGILRIRSDPIFYGPVSYSQGYIHRTSWLSALLHGSPTFIEGEPEKVAPLEFPASNEELKHLAQEDGLYFTGRTCILLNGNTLKIRNKEGPTISININDSIYKHKVIYVDRENENVPVGISYDDRFGLNNGNVFVTGKLKGRLTIAAYHDIYLTAKDPTNAAYWIPDKKTPWYWYFTNPFNATAAYKQSLYDDFPKLNPPGVTYASTTFNLVGNSYEANGDDMLGLIANNNIRILTKGWFEVNNEKKNNIDTSVKNFTIHAALFAIKGSFENYEYSTLPWGNSNVLTIRGALIQNVRGAVGLNYIDGVFIKIKAGYGKDYAHDPRMVTVAPPHFLGPKQSGWEMIEWTETRDHLTGS